MRAAGRLRIPAAFPGRMRPAGHGAKQLQRPPSLRVDRDRDRWLGPSHAATGTCGPGVYYLEQARPSEVAGAHSPLWQLKLIGSIKI